MTQREAARLARKAFAPFRGGAIRRYNVSGRELSHFVGFWDDVGQWKTKGGGRSWSQAWDDHLRRKARAILWRQTVKAGREVMRVRAWLKAQGKELERL